MGLPAFKEDFERLVADVAAPTDYQSAAGPMVEPASVEGSARRALQGTEDFNISMNKWRDRVETSLSNVRALITAFSNDADFAAIADYLVSTGLPVLVNSIDEAISMLSDGQQEADDRELRLRRVAARNPSAKKLVTELIRRQKLVFAKHLKTAGELREHTLELIWDNDRDTRTVTGVLSNDEDIDSYFNDLN